MKQLPHPGGAPPSALKLIPVARRAGLCRFESSAATFLCPNEYRKEVS
jgi:hypothetical protein